MGIYVNPNNADFQKALNSEIYVDKSELIKCTNRVLNTEQRFVCVSRPRRFGKSMALNMLAAYYSKGCDSKEMFSGLKISKADTFEKHLNKYNVIRINMVDYLEQSKSIEELISFIEDDLINEFTREYADLTFPPRRNLVTVLSAIYSQANIPFIFLIDEWDCILRRYRTDSEIQTTYLNFLKLLLKDKSYVALAYMTGILPIKKYGEHSALNIFTEISMTNARDFAEFTGFTEGEVESLCEKYEMSFEETKRWYDGYNLKGLSIYNPRSVVMSMLGHDFDNYWTQTETFEALKVYIEMNFDGLKDNVSRLIAGEKIPINTGKFQNDMATLNSADDVLTLLVHLGYLTYDFYEKTVWIPNGEVQQEFINSIEDGGWENVMKAIRQSEELLKATIKCDEEKVAGMVEEVHRNNVSIIKYNDENSLACVLTLAFYSARKNYSIHREMPAGEGYADIVFIPTKNNPNPAIVAELKWNKSPDDAISQIKEKKYSDCFQGYSGEILLVGISYDKDADTKRHVCRIEKVRKD